MKKILLLLVLSISVSIVFAQKKDEKAVRKCFDEYKWAILNDKGVEAVDCVDSRTLAYYTDIADHARNLDSAGVSALNLMDKFVVMTIRYYATKDQIMSFNGRDIFVFAIEKGMVGKNSVQQNTVGEVEVDGTFAKGQFLVYQEPTPFFWHFYKEEGEWKLDLTSSFVMGNMALKNMQEESGLSEDQYVQMLLEMMTGKKPGRELWQKVRS